MIELGALLLLAHSLAHVAAMAIAGRRILLEIGLHRYDPARHRLYCRQEGQGSVVLLLHGLGGSWRYWRRGLDGIRTHHTIYLPDLIGFGRSPKPRGEYSLSMHVEALAPIVAEVDGPITVVGHSMGALVALGLYARCPDRVKRLTLVGLPYFPSRALAEASLSKVALMNRLVIGRSWLAPAVCYMKDLLALPVFAPLAGMPVDLYRDYWKHTWASFSRSLFNTLLATDVAGLLAEVDRTRISLIHGRHDPVAPIEHVRGLVDRFPDLALRELKGGHHLYLMYPRLLNRLMTEAA
jgi:pimeloyl-ACP methyl ester carboxylesterase